MDLDQLQRLVTWGAILSFAIPALAILGELLDWWNDAAEVAITVATSTGVLLATGPLLLNATKGQVRSVSEGVERSNETLDRIHEDLQSVRGDPRSIGQETQRQTSVLAEIRDRLA